ncbi:uncharacterized protein LOC120345743 [Styela clava]
MSAIANSFGKSDKIQCTLYCKQRTLQIISLKKDDENTETGTSGDEGCNACLVRTKGHDNNKHCSKTDFKKHNTKDYLSKKMNDYFERQKTKACALSLPEESPLRMQVIVELEPKIYSIPSLRKSYETHFIFVVDFDVFTEFESVFQEIKTDDHISLLISDEKPELRIAKEYKDEVPNIPNGHGEDLVNKVRQRNGEISREEGKPHQKACSCLIEALRLESQKPSNHRLGVADSGSHSPLTSNEQRHIFFISDGHVDGLVNDLIEKYKTEEEKLGTNIPVTVFSKISTNVLQEIACELGSEPVYLFNIEDEEDSKTQINPNMKDNSKNNESLASNMLAQIKKKMENVKSSDFLKNIRVRLLAKSDLGVYFCYTNPKFVKKKGVKYTSINNLQYEKNKSWKQQQKSNEDEQSNMNKKKDYLRIHKSRNYSTEIEVFNHFLKIGEKMCFAFNLELIGPNIKDVMHRQIVDIKIDFLDTQQQAQTALHSIKMFIPNEWRRVFKSKNPDVDGYSNVDVSCKLIDGPPAFAPTSEHEASTSEPVVPSSHEENITDIDDVSLSVYVTKKLLLSDANSHHENESPSTAKMKIKMALNLRQNCTNSKDIEILIIPTENNVSLSHAYSRTNICEDCNLLGKCFCKNNVEVFQTEHLEKVEGRNNREILFRWTVDKTCATDKDLCGEFYIDLKKNKNENFHDHEVAKIEIIYGKELTTEYSLCVSHFDLLYHVKKLHHRIQILSSVRYFISPTDNRTRKAWADSVKYMFDVEKVNALGFHTLKGFVENQNKHAEEEKKRIIENLKEIRKISTCWNKEDVWGKMFKKSLEILAKYELKQRESFQKLQHVLRSVDQEQIMSEDEFQTNFIQAKMKFVTYKALSGAIMDSNDEKSNSRDSGHIVDIGIKELKSIGKDIMGWLLKNKNVEMSLFNAHEKSISDIEEATRIVCYEERSGVHILKYFNFLTLKKLYLKIAEIWHEELNLKESIYYRDKRENKEQNIQQTLEKDRNDCLKMLGCGSANHRERKEMKGKWEKELEIFRTKLQNDTDKSDTEGILQFLRCQCWEEVEALYTKAIIRKKTLLLFAVVSQCRDTSENLESLNRATNEIDKTMGNFVKKLLDMAKKTEVKHTWENSENTLLKTTDVKYNKENL